MCFGVDLDNEKGTNNGSINVKYFECKNKYGIFVQQYMITFMIGDVRWIGHLYDYNPNDASLRGTSYYGIDLLSGKGLKHATWWNKTCNISNIC